MRFYTRHNVTNFESAGRVYVEYNGLGFQLSEAEIRFRASQQREYEREPSVNEDVEEMARILDYIGPDYKNCTMDTDFCDYAQAFVERFVNKYQTHRAE